MDIVYRINNLPPEIFQKFGYLIIFGLVGIEGIPPLGVFSPGQFIMLFGGFLSKVGVLNIFILIFIGFIGSFSGDMIGYAMGKKLGYPFLSKYGKYVFIKKEGLEKTKQTLENHFFKTVFFSRFYGWTRVITPFLSGISHIPVPKFLLGSLLSCLSRSIFWPVIGYIFGQSYQMGEKYIGKFMFLGMVFGILTIFAYRYINKKRHIFNREYLYTLIINVVSLITLAKLADELAGHESIVRIDKLINFKVNLIASPFLDKIILTINSIGNLYVLIAMCLMFLIYLIYKKKKYHSLLFSLGIFTGLISNIIMKMIIGRLRPDNALIFLKDYSFPSGHATIATILFLTIRIIFEEKIPSKHKQLRLFIGCCVPIFIIGFSRIYLNVHRFSDVIAGFLFGVFRVTFMILILKFIMENKLDKNTVNIP